jgi:hypothetical protein
MTNAIGFDKDIKPLFREKDRDAMKGAFDLWDYADVVKHAQAILGALRSGKMPCDAAWPADRVALLAQWVEAGTPH